MDSQMDDVDLAEALVQVATKCAGPNSALVSEIKRLLTEGHSPQEIAAEIAHMIRALPDYEVGQVRHPTNGEN